MSGPGAVRLDIGELTVRGVHVLRPHLLGPAVETELAGLLRERGVPALWSSGGPSEPARPLTIRAGSSIGAEVLARRLALAVYEGLAG
jgi:hypothetical protein